MAEHFDPFEDFDIDSGSEKDFMIDHFKNHAPWTEMGKPLNARNSIPSHDILPYRCWDTTMTLEEWEETKVLAQICGKDYGTADWQEFKFMESATEEEIEARMHQLITSKRDENGNVPLANFDFMSAHPGLDTRVKEFIKACEFQMNTENAPASTQHLGFTPDVYDYALSIGLGHYVADVQVKIARATSRRLMGLPGRLMLEQRDDELRSGLEVEDSNYGAETSVNASEKETLSRKRKRMSAKLSEDEAKEAGLLDGEGSLKRKKQRTNHNGKSRPIPDTRVSSAGSEDKVMEIEERVGSDMDFRDLTSQISSLKSKRERRREKSKLAARVKNSVKAQVDLQAGFNEGTGFEDQDRSKTKKGRTEEAGKLLPKWPGEIGPNTKNKAVLEVSQKPQFMESMDLSSRTKPLSETTGRNEKPNVSHDGPKVANNDRRDRGRGKKRVTGYSLVDQEQLKDYHSWFARD